ncbi:MAG: TRAP transporter small permease [Paracoccaceae bacterium]|jgi:TRAP-type mannitol/chloroaromatic compound transport system permease small subunit|uniref:TRAP transporter small permease subunit n=1 Tax=unclassified Seohaeicola TaxID=2641111 RepID=UPI00237BC294|nr:MULTISPECIES: TRAP transporter small permease [unclassified Seohaeicola]MDD9706626.1 TRAP transporter small permease [Seohaeicola sp. 4SK31]MDD9734332.1 TRAP transporter small permease [Seohaeicola sp. SP36]MDM7968320.1 TRAP transporter small permease [Paracoccaceae bacterium]
MTGSDRLAGTAMQIAGSLRTANRWIALLCGIVLLGAVALIMTEVLGRQFPAMRVGGADELSGYVMAAIATWGFSYALVERAHVRIDLIHNRLPVMGRAVLDIIALASVLLVAVLVAWHAYDVLAKSLARGSRSNTPLGVPLWMPQIVWFGGWAWMVVTTSLLLALTVVLTVLRRFEMVEQIASIPVETGEVE